MTSVPDGMSIADAKGLLALGEKLLEHAYELPDPPARLAIPECNDALSRAIAARAADVDQRTIEGLRATKAGMIEDAQNLIDSARAVLDNSIANGARK